MGVGGGGFGPKRSKGLLGKPGRGSTKPGGRQRGLEGVLSLLSRALEALLSRQELLSRGAEWTAPGTGVTGGEARAEALGRVKPQRGEQRYESMARRASTMTRQRREQADKTGGRVALSPGRGWKMARQADA